MENYEIKEKFAEASKDIWLSNGLDVHSFYKTSNPEVVYATKESHVSMVGQIGKSGREIKRLELKDDLMKAINCFYELRIYNGKQETKGTLFKRKAVGDTDTGKDYYQAYRGKDLSKIGLKDKCELESLLEATLDEVLS